MEWLSKKENNFLCFGNVRHEIWFLKHLNRFFARSGLVNHGPYKGAEAAKKACKEYENNT